MDRRPLRNKKSTTRNAKPYDRPNQSILGKVASKFKGILNKTWISQWMGQPEEEEDPQDEESAEDEDEVQSSSTATSHRSKIPRLEQPFLSEGTQTWPETPSSSLFNPSSHATHNSLLENKADQVIINGDDHSENSEGSASTSGCSSLVSSHKERLNCLPAPNRRRVQSPFESIRNDFSRRKEGLTDDMSASRMSLWSGAGGFSPAAKFQQRSPSVANTHQPGFNVSAFVGSSKSNQQPDRKVASPFYQGNTSFGGASSTRRMPVSVAPYQVDRPTRNQIKVRPKESEDSLEGMSSAAKRILMTLEKMSSPVTDAKKIPNTNRSPVDLSLYMMPPRLRSNVVSTPTITKGPPIANISTISKLTTLKSCMNRFQNSATESFSLPKETRNTPVLLPTLSETTQQDTTPQPLSPNRRTGKMRCKLTQKHQSNVRNEEFEYTPLPSIPLPISTLPTFKQTNPQVTFDPKPSRPTNDTSKLGLEFEFSPPIEVQPTPILQSSLPLKSDRPSSVEKLPFTFSNPTELETPAPMPGLFTTNFNSTNWSCSGCWVQNPAKEVKCMACETPRNNSNSLPAVNSPLSSNKFNSLTKPASTWQCSECWIQNPSTESKCQACETPKKIPTTASSGFSKPSAKPSPSWSCAECWVQNSADESKCVACDTPKKPASTGLSNSTKPMPAAKSSSWSCHECWIQNPAHATKCLACEAVKKGESGSADASKLSASIGFGGGSSSKQSMWTCNGCWVQNPIDKAKCLACEAPNPSQEKSSGPFRLNPSSENSQAGFKYPSGMAHREDEPKTSTFIKSCVASNETKKVDASHTTPNGAIKLSSGFPVSDWECDTCLAKNASDKLKCLACETLRPSKRSHSGSESFKFNSPSQNSPITFKFGSFSIPISTATTTSTCSFGGSSSTGASSFFAAASNLTTTTAKSSEESKTAFSTDTSTLKTVPGFKFGASNVPTIEITKPEIPVVDLVDNEDTNGQSSNIFGSAVTQTSENSISSTAFKVTPVSSKSDSGVSSFFKPPSSTGKGSEEPKSTTTDLSTSKSAASLFKFGAANKPATETTASNIPVVDLVDNDNKAKPTNIFAPAISKTSSEISASNVFNITPSIGNTNFSMPASSDNKRLSFASTKEDNSAATPQPTLNSIPIGSQTGQSKDNPTGGFNFKAPTALASSTFGGFSMPTSNSDSSKTLLPTIVEEKPSSKGLEASADKKSDSSFFLGVSSSSSSSPFSLTTSNASVFKMGDQVDAAAKTTESAWGKSDLTSSTNSAAAPLFSFGAAATTSSNQFSTNIAKDAKPAVSVAPFSAAPTTSSFSFGNMAATTTTQSSAPSGGFSFFGATTAAAPATAGNPGLFTFGASTNASQPAKTGGFPATTTTTSVFGASSIPASTSAFVFGGAVKSEPVNSTSSNFAFGSGTQPSAAPSSFSGFQSSSQPAPAQQNVFQFGSQPSNNTSATPAFGGSSGTFAFGAKSEAPNPAATSQATGFGAPSMQQQQSMFGGSVIAAPTFGAKTDKPAGFNFGAAAPAATPFMFGNMDNKQPPNQFSFGNIQESQNAAQFQPQQPAFNISTPTTFNFGATSAQAGPFQFAAASTPNEQSTGPRKIRKAVRRVRN